MIWYKTVLFGKGKRFCYLPHPIIRQLTVCQVEDHVMTLEKALDLVIVPFAYAKLEWTRVGWRETGRGISLYQVKEDFFQLRLVRLSLGFCQDAFHEFYFLITDIKFFGRLVFERLWGFQSFCFWKSAKMTRPKWIHWAHRCVTLLQ